MITCCATELVIFVRPAPKGKNQDVVQQPVQNVLEMNATGSVLR